MWNNFEMLWITDFLFILGLLIFIIGLWMIFLPQHFLRMGKVLGKWVSTEEYFSTLDKPHYQERAIYRHHRIIGGLIVLGACYTMISLLNVDLETMRTGLASYGNPFWTEWIFTVVYYLLISGNFVAIIMGLVVFIRPSLLKDIEKLMNKWIVSDEGLKKLDHIHEVPANILPGKPRLFGVIVALGGLYIMMTTWNSLF